jgi:hypothetical protein
MILAWSCIQFTSYLIKLLHLVCIEIIVWTSWYNNQTLIILDNRNHPIAHGNINSHQDKLKCKFNIILNGVRDLVRFGYFGFCNPEHQMKPRINKRKTRASLPWSKTNDCKLLSRAEYDQGLPETGRQWRLIRTCSLIEDGRRKHRSRFRFCSISSGFCTTTPPCRVYCSEKPRTKGWLIHDGGEHKGWRWM